jgi:hypothetical protein
LLRFGRWRFLFVSKEIIHDYSLLIGHIFQLAVVWAQMKQVNINKYILCFVHLCICVYAREILCMCFWVTQISSPDAEYSVFLHARFITICYFLMWPTASGSDSNKVAFISCYWQLRHFCMFFRPVLSICIYQFLRC